MSTSVEPLCSICIANYNGIALIDACIKSVLAQDCDFPIEIIVHDDASTDESVAHIRQHYKDVVLIESAANVGFCISNNRMVEKARGQYVLLLNNDAELFSDALRTLHEAATSLGKPAVLGLPQYSASTGELIDIGSRFDPFLNPIPNHNRSQQEVGMVIGACLWLQRSLWNELGGFPEWFGSVAEDAHLCCNARLRGYPVLALPRSGFKHWVGQSLGGGKIEGNKLATRASRRALSERNKNYVMFLTYPLPLLILILPLHLLLLLVEGVLISAVKKDAALFSRIYLSSFKALWEKRKILMRARLAIQSQRTCSVVEFWRPFTWCPHKLTILRKHGVPNIAS